METPQTDSTLTSSTIKDFVAENIDLKLVRPSVSILRDAKFRYNKIFTSAIKEGFFTKKRLEESLKQGEVNLIELHIARRAEVLNLYAETNAKLADSKDPELIEYYANMLSFYRDALVREDMDMTNLFSTTAEQFAEDERLNYLTFMLIKKKDGTSLWENEEAFYNEDRVSLVEVCKYNIICWEYKLDPDWQKTLPEVQALVRAKDIREIMEKEAEAKKAKPVEITKKKEKKVTKKNTKKTVKEPEETKPVST